MASHADKTWKKEVKNFWFEIQATYELDIDQLTSLRVSCNQYNRYLEAKEQLDVEGLCVMGKTTPHVHPVAHIEKDSFKNFLAGLKMLGINAPQEAATVSRPSTAKLIGL